MYDSNNQTLEIEELKAICDLDEKGWNVENISGVIDVSIETIKDIIVFVNYVKTKE